MAPFEPKTMSQSWPIAAHSVWPYWADIKPLTEHPNREHWEWYSNFGAELVRLFVLTLRLADAYRQNIVDDI
jgi:hypothetical protein